MGDDTMHVSCVMCHVSCVMCYVLCVEQQAQTRHRIRFADDNDAHMSPRDAEVKEEDMTVDLAPTYNVRGRGGLWDVCWMQCM